MYRHQILKYCRKWEISVIQEEVEVVHHLNTNPNKKKRARIDVDLLDRLVTAIQKDSVVMSDGRSVYHKRMLMIKRLRKYREVLKNERD